MPRLSNEVVRRIDALARDLRHFEDGAPSALPRIVDVMHDLSDCDRAVGLTYEPRQDRGAVQLGLFTFRGARPDLRDRYNKFLAGHPVDWTLFNPMRPEPEQRNIAFDAAGLCKLTDMPDISGLPVVREFLRPVGMDRDDSIRALVCDRGSLLAYIGLYHGSRLGPRRLQIVQRLVPLVKRRMQLERLLAGGELDRVMFEAAFSLIARPAFVVDHRGRLLEANAAAVAWLAHEGRAGYTRTREAARRSDPDFDRVEIAQASTQLLMLVMRGQLPGYLSVAAAGTRLGLTRRQRDVLELVVDGLANRTIAAELKLAERTVEQHLTDIMDRAQVGSRAQLISLVWRLQ
jgi:DNA-binding CsgD family transcriptional regulator